jgi:hypothetical protein
MRVSRDERLQLRVPTLELEIMPAQVARFGPEPLVLRLELPDLLGEGVDSALLLVEVGRAVEGVGPNASSKSLKSACGPLR